MENNQGADSRPNSQNSDWGVDDLGEPWRAPEQVNNDVSQRPPVPDGILSEREQLGRICATCEEFIPAVIEQDWTLGGHICPGVMRPQWVRYHQFVDRRSIRARSHRGISRHRSIVVEEDPWTTLRQGSTSVDVHRLTVAINNARRNRQNPLLRQIVHERLQDVIDGVYEDTNN